MKESRPISHEDLFYLICGSMDADLVHSDPHIDIPDLFEEGLPCAQLYNEIYSANRHLCARLGMDEDSDLELIITNCFDIAYHLSMQMYEYGKIHLVECEVHTLKNT